MATPLLSTKLYIPSLRPNVVPRPRLIQRLEEGLRRGHKLTLVSAPAGFGKTTLLSEWAADCERQVAWLSLDAHDDDPTRFWTYVCAAVRRAATGVGETPLAMLAATPQPDIHTILTALINELAAQPSPIILVLDDYQMIKTKAIHDGLTFLLDYAPPQLHLAIATRIDPPLNIARLRIRGQMTGLRVKDLRFTSDKAAFFLNQVSGLALSPANVAQLQARTEGWIAGLQAAVMALQGRDDVSEFIAAFTGSHRYVLSYLIQEVLQRQPQHIQTFLLQTSILERLCGALCEALTGQEGGQETLEWLERANLFVVPLDDEGRWYRYHHLFGDMLRARLGREFEAREIQAFHRRASDWHDQNGFVLQAVKHALEAGDHERVVQLIERYADEIFRRSELHTLVSWIQTLPGVLVESHSLLSMIYGWALLATGHTDDAERCMRDVERAVGATADVLAADSAERRSLTPETLGALVEVTVLRISPALSRFDLPLALALAQRALLYLQDDEQAYLYNRPSSLRTVVKFNLAMAHEFSGQVVAATQAFAEAVELSRAEDNHFITLMATSRLAQLFKSQGRLRAAHRVCREALEWTQDDIGSATPILGVAHVELGNLLFEWNELDAALEHLQKGIALLKPWGHWQGLPSGYEGLAHTRRALGDWEGAFEIVDELIAFCGMPQAPPLLPFAQAVRATLWAAQGELDAAAQWLAASGLGPEDPLNYLQEPLYLCLARVILALGRLDDAARLLARLLIEAETGERHGRAIEILALQALTFEAQGERADALEALERALTLAEPEGYVRAFVDGGEAMAALLSQVEVLPAYVERLLAALGEALRDDERAESPVAHPPLPPLVEPLSERELELLRLVAAGLTNQAIAGQLVVSVNTVKTHARNIYGKLGVRNRTQAAARARELGLI